LTDLAIGNTYASWCGVKNTKGSMFIVIDDGKGNILISMNPWDAEAYGNTTGDYSLNRTLAYSIALPFYYSNLSNRIANLGTPFKKFKTKFFMGFFNDGRLRLTEQPYPYVYEEPETPGAGGKKKRSIWTNLLVAAAVGYAAYAFIGAVTLLGFTIGAVAVGVSVGLGTLLLLAVCFTGDSLISMADGTFKMIKDIQIGDKVFNHDKTQVNTVTYVEVTPGSTYGQLYSITPDQEPFITINHPMYIDGVLSSVYPDKTYEAYPWLGKTQPLIPDRIIDASDEPVYNLWTTGDGTFIVNGYGTTTIMRDGGWGRLLVEQGITTPARLNEVLLEFAGSGKDASYGAYVCNRVFGVLNIKLINKIVGKIVDNKEPTLARRAVKQMFKIVGKVTVYITERKARK